MLPAPMLTRGSDQRYLWGPAYPGSGSADIRVGVFGRPRFLRGWLRRSFTRLSDLIASETTAPPPEPSSLAPSDSPGASTGFILPEVAYKIRTRDGAVRMP
jgi:hypothetical protein